MSEDGPGSINGLMRGLEELAKHFDWSQLGDVPVDIWVRYVHRGDELEELIANYGDEYSEDDIRRWVQWLDENW